MTLHLTRGRLTRRHLIGLLPVSAVVGCGFQPVYMPTATGQPGLVERELASIDVVLIQDRPGQVLRQALQQKLASDGGTRHRYILRASFWITGEGLGIGPDNQASRLRLTGHSNWSLMSTTPPNTVIAKGSGRVTDGYDVFNSQYFAQDMENDQVTRRIALAIADQVVLQIALHFRHPAATAS